MTVRTCKAWHFNKDLAAGTSLYIPVQVPGALFQTGDGHDGQSNGEVDITSVAPDLSITQLVDRIVAAQRRRETPPRPDWLPH